MTENSHIKILGFIFLLFGDVYWLGALLFPESILKFTLLLAPDIEYSNLNSQGRDVAIVMIGIIGALCWAIGVLLYYISKNPTSTSNRWIQYAAIAWVVGDSIISAMYNFEYNLLSNTLFIMIILLLTRKTVST